ncbi:Uncharacterized protein APZ42_019346 [Daphnia magna]|uniref:Uncharacterized protein n=1 Tax=Daphnia magna TaxID=35525 RepID=A0A164YH55_9CRUS|nr:Uncharacterized protein APZ42_019346 [Daphnia magna]
MPSFHIENIKRREKQFFFSINFVFFEKKKNQRRRSVPRKREVI